MGSVVKSAGNVVKTVGSKVLGGGGAMGMLGTGRQRVGDVAIDEKAYDDPYADKRRKELAAKQLALANRNAPTIKDTQIERAEGPTAAQIGTVAAPQAAQIGTVAGPEAAQIAETDLSQQQNLRTQQEALTAQLQARAAGTAPSLAQQELKKAQDRNLAAVMAAQATTRGISPALAARNVARQQAQMGAETQQQAATLALQERMSAEQNLGQMLQAQRGQELQQSGLQAQQAQVQAQLQQQAGLAGAEMGQQQALQQAAFQQQAGMQGAEMAQQRALTQAQLQQQAGLVGAEFGQQTALQQAQMGQQAELARAQMAQQEQAQQDQMTQYYMSLGFSTDQAQLQAQKDLQTAKLQKFGMKEGLEQKAFATAAAGRQKLAGGVMQGIGSLAAMSDKRMKKNIKDGGKPVQKFLDALSAKLYEYKDEAPKDVTAPGIHIGIMAQDLEKSDLGKRLVMEDEDNNKLVKSGMGFGTVLASLAHLNEKLQNLEARRK